ncbi:MAG: hypothetical protein EBU73_00155 [Chitinophagia bacterium]|nr:hypothetical protein [Chitinophagia bacterium]
MFCKINYFIAIAVCIFSSHVVYSQEIEETNRMIEQADIVQDDQDLTKMIGIDRSVKVDINIISREEMMKHQFLNIKQVESFFEYKKTYGKIISMFELQAIPLWNADIIKKLMNIYSVITYPAGNKMVLEQRESGFQRVVMRIGRSGSSGGSFDQFQKGLKETMIYRNAKYNNLYAGYSAEKDIGEKNIFDFNSFFIQKERFWIFKKIILGDYLISMGQGLVHWNGYAFGKNSHVLSILRQAQLIKPHTGTEENRFFRGAAIELEKKRRSLILFISRKKIDANIIMDSASQKKWASSLLLSGLHRNENELADKHSLVLMSSGVSLKQDFKTGHVSLNSITHFTDIPIQKRNLPYNTYSLNGNHWFNLSSDFVFSVKNGTIFGELGIDKKKSTGAILGYLKSLNRYTDIGIQWRNISSSYNSFSSNIIGHQSSANNEKGIYMGINMKIDSKSSIEMFVDKYKHPFPVYTTDGPQRGIMSSLTFTYKPSKKVELYARITEKRSNQNENNGDVKTHNLCINTTYQTRLHGSFHVNEAVELRIRNEIFSKRGEQYKNLFGWLNYIEFILHPVLQPYSISFRSSFYNTDGYESSIYAMERDLPHYYSMNSFFGRGTSSYILFQYSINPKISFSGKWMIDKKFYDSNRPISDFFITVNSSWRTQLTIKF